jgi:hypothetical protein
MKPTEAHYYKHFDPSHYRNIYHCKHYNDIGFIPKDECWDGDLVHVENGDLTYIFKHGNWEIIMV